MKLTNQNIEQLYKFTRQHYVEHCDVQTELVDHLANDIEQIWKEKPTLDFEQARDLSFKKFGVFGFMNVVEEKQKQMSKKYFKIILTFVKEWFKLPKLLLTLLIIFVFYSIQKIEFSYYIFITLYALIFIVEFVVMFKRRNKLKVKYDKTGKKWMFEDIIETQGYGNIVFITAYMLQFFTPDNFSDLSFLGSILISLAITLTIIVGYISLFIIPKKSQELLEEHYPEYKLV